MVQIENQTSYCRSTRRFLATTSGVDEQRPGLSCLVEWHIFNQSGSNAVWPCWVQAWRFTLNEGFHEALSHGLNLWIWASASLSCMHLAILEGVSVPRVGNLMSAWLFNIARIRIFVTQEQGRIPRLDGVRGKKHVCRPHVRTSGFSEANVLY